MRSCIDELLAFVVISFDEIITIIAEVNLDRAVKTFNIAPLTKR